MSILYHCVLNLTVTKGDNGVDLISSLCNMYETSEDELRKTLEKANDLIASILKKTPRSASECKTENLNFIDAGTPLVSSSC